MLLLLKRIVVIEVASGAVKVDARREFALLAVALELHLVPIGCGVLCHSTLQTAIVG